MTELGQDRGAPTQRAGWYPDPSAAGYHRYWDGTAWTRDAFPNGPASPSSPPAGSPVADSPFAGSPPMSASPAAAGEPAVPPRPTSSGLGFVALVLGLMLVVGSLAVVGGYYAFGRRSSSPTAAARPVPSLPIVPNLPTVPNFPTVPIRPTVPPTPVDPSASVLAGLVVNQADLALTGFVLPRPLGDELSKATLDLCQGSFPSESLRTARLQVDVLELTATLPLSTEAVLYSSAAATAQGFAELKAVSAACPESVKLNPTPDGAWPQVPTVDRLAFDFVSTDQAGTASHDVAVYLRRGRVLMGVYFYFPAADQVTIAGQTTLAGITNVFATRMANLPAAVVG